MHLKNRILLLICMMTWISLIISGFSFFFLYRTAIEEIKMRLVETVESQARMIEIITDFEAAHGTSFAPESLRSAIISRVHTAHNKYEQAGLTMEFAIAERNGDWISYLLRHRHSGLEDHLTPVSFYSDRVVPMQQALLGKSGVTMAEDYRGKMVLAAYEPLNTLNLGLVAQVDLSEIRAPFLRTGLNSSIFALLVLGIGAALFFKLGNPLIDKINQQNSLLLDANQSLKREISERIDLQKKLEKAKEELEMRVSARTAELSIANKQLMIEMDERREAEQELKRNETLLRKIVDGILEPLIMLDQNLTVMMMNQAAIEYYQLENKRNIIGATCHFELMNSAEVCQGCNVMQAMHAGKKITQERKGIMNPDRTEKVVAYPILEGDGSISSIIIRVSDITEQKLIERQIIQKEKLSSLDTIVSSIAHEINNPNNFILFNIPILRDYLDEMLPIIAAYASDKPDFELCNLSYHEFTEDIAKLITNIENGSQRINSFIANLRGYINNTGESSREAVELTSTIDNVYSICRSNFSNNLKSFSKNIQDDLPELYAQPYAIEQILINFLINACHATDKEDSWVKLDVAANEERSQIVISVSDNGHGMDEKTLSKVFDPFYTTKSTEGGTGLGLYVSHLLARKMGGEIFAESRQGEGSKFILKLPLRGPHRNGEK